MGVSLRKDVEKEYLAKHGFVAAKFDKYFYIPEMLNFDFRNAGYNEDFLLENVDVLSFIVDKGNYLPEHVEHTIDEKERENEKCEVANRWGEKMSTEE